MNQKMRILFFFLLALSFSACGKDKDYLVTISTRHGEIKAILFDDTPVHKENFLDLAESGRFDSTQFHRVIQGFMVQGGDVFTKEGLPYQNWPTLPAEIRRNHVHTKGMLAAAREGDDSNPQKRRMAPSFTLYKEEPTRSKS